MNEKARCITINCGCCGDGGNESTKEVYSFDEIEVGTWVDGKTIYRKVFEKSDFTSNIVNSVVGIVSDVDTVINLGGKISWYTNALNQRIARSLPYSSPQYSTYADLMFRKEAGEIALLMDKGDAKVTPPGSHKVYVIIEYTKQGTEETA